MNNREKVILTRSLFALYGLWHVFDQWTRVLVPFTQWQLKPRPDITTILAFNALSTTFTLVGALFFAQLLESYGYRRTAIVATIATALYQGVLGVVQNNYVYIGLQSLLVFSNLPMIVDSSIVHIVGEDGDMKQRTRLISKLVVPLSMAYAAGPYIALQIIWWITSDINASQIICGVLHFLTIIPIAWKCLPDNPTEKPLRLPEFSTYKQLLADSRTYWSLILLMLVTGPYSAYDQVIRVQIANTILLEPNKMATLFLILGGTSLLVNIFIIPYLQTKFNPRFNLIVAFSLLIFSYLYLSSVEQYEYLLVGMPLQVVGVSICLGELSSQTFYGVGKVDAGKVAALIRICTLFAQVMTPLISGYYIEAEETRLLCYVSAFFSLVSLGLVFRFGHVMKAQNLSLPMDGAKFE